MIVTRTGRKPQNYRWIAQNENGDWCGHWHTHLRRASMCARSWERFHRRQHNQRQVWTLRQLEAGDL